MKIHEIWYDLSSKFPPGLKKINDAVHDSALVDLRPQTLDPILYLYQLSKAAGSRAGIDSGPGDWLESVGVNHDLILGEIELRFDKRPVPRTLFGKPKPEPQPVFAHTQAFNRMVRLLYDRSEKRAERGVPKEMRLVESDLLEAVLLSDSEAVAAVFGRVGLTMVEARRLAAWVI